jgi:hypothetical protein
VLKASQALHQLLQVQLDHKVALDLQVQLAQMVRLDRLVRLDHKVILDPPDPPVLKASQALHQLLQVRLDQQAPQALHQSLQDQLDQQVLQAQMVRLDRLVRLDHKVHRVLRGQLDHKEILDRLVPRDLLELLVLQAQ